MEDWVGKGEKVPTESNICLTFYIASPLVAVSRDFFPHWIDHSFASALCYRAF